MLPNVCINRHLARSLVNPHVEDAGATLDKLRAIRREACLASVSQVNAAVIAPEVAAVVTANANPLDSALLLKL